MDYLSIIPSSLFSTNPSVIESMAQSRIVYSMGVYFSPNNDLLLLLSSSYRFPSLYFQTEALSENREARLMRKFGKGLVLKEYLFRGSFSFRILRRS